MASASRLSVVVGHPVSSRSRSGVCIGTPTRHNVGKVTYVYIHVKDMLIDSERTVTVPFVYREYIVSVSWVYREYMVSVP